MLLASNRNYRLLFSASAISNLGDGISALAFPWLATLITRDPGLIALVAFATRLPWLLFAIPAGVITDRVDRKMLMMRADLFRLLLTGAVIALILSVPSFPPESDAALYILALSALAFLLGTAEVLRDNAAQTALPSVVEKAQLEKANGQIWSIEQIMGSFVGPPLAGLLIAFAVPAPFAVDALTFGLAAWMIWCIAMPPRIAPARRSLWVETVEGARWVWAHKTILQLAIMLGLFNFAAIMATTILILYSQEILGLSAAGYGLLMTAGALGGVIGGLVSPAIATRLGRRLSLFVAMGVSTVHFFMIAVTATPVVVAFALFLEMLAALLWNVVTVSYRQRLIPDDLLGRVNSIYRFFGWGTMPLGALIGGWLVAWGEPDLGRDMALRLPYVVAGAITGLMLIYGLFRLRLA
ncbi:MFS transporter [Actibacterium sp. 188UL27-1]|uniref:MFS transporter n=1 Tax=Actibacterium sp. 188UL27-1 TaxID=2786961 RepID=UPI00195EFE54|nr:MFS transporter [Actibacterium sp. 188UL27-1]MBM7068188.1 MFS transporter [Actibacterium sp. 188UL27-1]